MGDWNLPRDPLEALRAGDSAPFEQFVEDHARTFFSFFRRRGLSPEQAEDLTQELFLRVFDHASRYRPSERFRGLCYRIARNLWIDERRRSAPQPTNSSSDEEGGGLRHLEATRRGEGEEPVEAMIVHEEAGRLRAALRILSPGHRDVFELAVVEGLGYGEISRVLDVPVGTVKSRMFHAVRRLRAALAADPQEGEARP